MSVADILLNVCTVEYCNTKLYNTCICTYAHLNLKSYIHAYISTEVTSKSTILSKNCYQLSIDKLSQLIGAAVTEVPVHFPSLEWMECSPLGCRWWSCQHYPVPCTKDGVPAPQHNQYWIQYAPPGSSGRPC